jgi:hypothetical protein
LRNTPLPRITFGIIVLNGEPFTRYCLHSLYPFAHEIIVVEGGHEQTASVSTPDGHSIDGTLDTLRRFKESEDPENKVQIVTRNGFWPRGNELANIRTFQSRAYAERATGDYLWQVDIDEFYRSEDMSAVGKMLCDDPAITAVTFPTYTFWGSPEIRVNGWPLLWSGMYFQRLFKWGPGYHYLTHEPPTVLDSEGRNLLSLKQVSGPAMARRGIWMYHYAFLLPWQVKQKSIIYQDEKPRMMPGMVRWAENSYFHLKHPYQVHNLYHYPSWLERYGGPHPAEAIRMWQDVKSGAVEAEVRPSEDAERLLRSPAYATGRALLRLMSPTVLLFLKGRLALWKRTPEALKRAIRKSLRHKR